MTDRSGPAEPSLCAHAEPSLCAHVCTEGRLSGNVWGGPPSLCAPVHRGTARVLHVDACAGVFTDERVSFMLGGEDS